MKSGISVRRCRIFYAHFFNFSLRKCGNIWNLCEVFPARLTEKCLYHYNGYDVDFMQNFTKPAVGEKKNMTKRQKRFLALMLGAVLLGDCAAHTGTMISGLSSVYAAYTGDDGIYRKKTCLRSCCDSGFRDNGIRREDLV